MVELLVILTSQTSKTVKKAVRKLLPKRGNTDANFTSKSLVPTDSKVSGNQNAANPWRLHTTPTHNIHYTSPAHDTHTQHSHYIYTKHLPTTPKRNTFIRHLPTQSTYPHFEEEGPAVTWQHKHFTVVWSNELIAGDMGIYSSLIDRHWRADMV